MNTQHTPGPWHVGMKPGPMVYGPSGEQVANMHVAMLDQPEHIANARLIAAAPELLDALNAMLAAMNNSKQWANMEFAKQADDAKRLARAAIAKATQP